MQGRSPGWCQELHGVTANPYVARWPYPISSGPPRISWDFPGGPGACITCSASIRRPRKANEWDDTSGFLHFLLAGAAMPAVMPAGPPHEFMIKADPGLVPS